MPLRCTFYDAKDNAAGREVVGIPDHDIAVFWVAGVEDHSYPVSPGVSLCDWLLWETQWFVRIVSKHILVLCGLWRPSLQGGYAPLHLIV